MCIRDRYLGQPLGGQKPERWATGTTGKGPEHDNPPASAGGLSIKAPYRLYEPEARISLSGYSAAGVSPSAAASAAASGVDSTDSTGASSAALATLAALARDFAGAFASAGASTSGTSASASAGAASAGAASAGASAGAFTSTAAASATGASDSDSAMRARTW